MPIYEYECRRCGHRFELIQKFSDKPRKRCPECSGGVDRLISPPAIRFKGTGWYVTDYANKGKSDKGKSDNGKGDNGGANKGGDGSEGTDAAKSKDGTKKSDADMKAGGKKDKLPS